MGMYWQGYKTQFDKIDFQAIENSKYEFWSELKNHCDKIDFQIKSTYLTENTIPIEYGTRIMQEVEREFYNTFFYFTVWMTYDKEDEKFINKVKYTINSTCDDLGWLKLKDKIYFRSFNSKTLEGIVEDYKKVDFSFIQERFNLERMRNQKTFSIDKKFDPSKYQNETEEVFLNFKNLTDQMINIYKNCVSENKDLIICYD